MKQFDHTEYHLLSRGEVIAISINRDIVAHRCRIHNIAVFNGFMKGPIWAIKRVRIYK